MKLFDINACKKHIKCLTTKINSTPMTFGIRHRHITSVKYNCQINKTQQ